MLDPTRFRLPGNAILVDDVRPPRSTMIHAELHAGSPREPSSMTAVHLGGRSPGRVARWGMLTGRFIFRNFVRMP